MFKTNLDIDRKTASKILGVSVRTIDRHIRAGKLSSRQENGRIWLNKKEIKDFGKRQKFIAQPTIDTVSYVYSKSQDVRKISDDNNFYKDLYEEAKNALNEYRQKLDQSNYRIGQLESQLLHSSSQKATEKHEDYFSMELLKKDLIEREKELLTLKDLFKREKTNRTILTAIVYVLLAMLPLVWYLLR